MAQDGLRQALNKGICTAAVAARAAIRGGLDPQDAFLASDLYIQKLELTNDPAAIERLIQEMMIDCAQRVERLRGPGPDRFFRLCARYVSQNIFTTIRAERMVRDAVHQRVALLGQPAAQSVEVAAALQLHQIVVVGLEDFVRVRPSLDGRPADHHQRLIQPGLDLLHVSAGGEQDVPQQLVEQAVGLRLVHLYHDFDVEPGTGPVVIGEVSQCNGDNTDNRFNPPVGRFPTIEGGFLWPHREKTT